MNCLRSWLALIVIFAAAPLPAADEPTDKPAASPPAKEQPSDASPARPEEKQANDQPATYRLAYKFKSGDQLRWHVVHRATVKSTIEGTTDSAQTRSESLKVWDVKDVTDNGEIVFVHWVERIKMTNKLPGRAEMTYDSAKDATPPAGFEQAAQAVGVPLTEIRMTPAGKIQRRIQRHIQRGANNETPIAFPLPEGDARVGHVWTEPHSVPVSLKSGGTRKIETRRRFELKSVVDGIATISIDYQILTPSRDPAIDAQLVQRLYQGTFQFDIEAGHVSAVKMDVDKRVLGFSGPSSAMHYLMQFTEKLLPAKEVAERSRLKAGPALPPK